MTGPQIRDILSRVPDLEIAPEDYGDLDAEQLVFQQRAQQWADRGTGRDHSKRASQGPVLLQDQPTEGRLSEDSQQADGLSVREKGDLAND